MKLTPRQQRFLAGISRDRETARQRWATPAPEAITDPAKRAHARNQTLHVEAGRVPCNAAQWLGRPLTQSDKVKVHRCYAQLEAKGLVERLDRYGERCGGRTAFLKLTPEGEALAAPLIAHTEMPSPAVSELAPVVASSTPETKPGTSPVYVSVFEEGR